MLIHLTGLATKKCVMVAPFFLGNSRYKRVEPLVKSICLPSFDDLVKSAFSGHHYWGAACIYEFGSSGEGLLPLMFKWIHNNDLHEYFIFDVKESVSNNLKLYSGQEFFLPVNPMWFFSYIYSGFKMSEVNKFSILGKVDPAKKSWGLVYSSQAELDKAREHYQSTKVKQVLCCGHNFGWKHLRAI